MKKSLIILFAIFSIASFSMSILEKNDVKSLLHGVQGGIYLIISTLVIPKIMEKE